MNMTKEDRFYQKVRLIQRRTKCSNYVCDEFVKLYRIHATEEENGGSLNSFDKKCKHVAGVNYLVLHGCPSCDKYIYTKDDDNENCPFVKADGTVCGHPRYNEKNAPFEVCYVSDTCIIMIAFLLLCEQHTNK